MTDKNKLNNDTFSSENINKNKEVKYREEIFELLKNTLGDIEQIEYDMIKELFLTDEIKNEILLDRLKKQYGD